jgi:hypothetical protein
MSAKPKMSINHSGGLLLGERLAVVEVGEDERDDDQRLAEAHVVGKDAALKTTPIRISQGSML